MDNEAKLDNERLKNEIKLEYYINKSKNEASIAKSNRRLKILVVVVWIIAGGGAMLQIYNLFKHML